MKGKASPSKQYSEPGEKHTSYGSSANVRESTAQSYDKPTKSSKPKAGAYSKYK